MTTQKKTHAIDMNMMIDGAMWVSEEVSLSGGLTSTAATTLSGTSYISAIRLNQTLGGTDVTARWAGAAAPVLTIGNWFFTFSYGASTFRVPCFPTT